MSELQKDKEVKSESKYYMPVMISLIIGVIYSSGFWYSFSYLSYFNLYRFESLSIQPSYYLINAAVPIAIAIAILSPLLLPYSELRFKAGIHNLTVLIPAILLVILYYYLYLDYSHGIIYGIFGIIVPFGLVIIYIVFSKNKLSIRDIFLVPDFKRHVLGLLYLAIILLCICNAAGELSAMYLVEGDKIITFNWNGNHQEDISNKEFVPIFHYNENYYVAERMKPAPKNPIVYAIPDNQVESAAIKVVDEDKTSKSSSIQKYNN
ncbi:MAG: hypothetical protein KAH86_04380 [Methanosarcinales archaeon]|nr:hypothetical protein [Methanosarcinales archaeon]